jgi:predicted helicase
MDKGWQGRMGSFGALLSRFDSDPLIRGAQFERVCHWHIKNDPLYRRELSHVWMWKGWPGRWGAGAGIDIIDECRDGSLLATRVGY